MNDTQHRGFAAVVHGRTGSTARWCGDVSEATMSERRLTRLDIYLVGIYDAQRSNDIP
jgi:hypothetical protein